MRRYIFLSSLALACAGLVIAPSVAAQEPEEPDAPPPAPPPTPAAAKPAPKTSELEEELEFEGTAQVEAPPREVTRRSVENQVVWQMPGTRGDALRAIEIMPGVARTSMGQGDPILRGAAAGESQGA